ncbi:unnamed protein product, partial [Symbiodinium microadriaticum]
CIPVSSTEVAVNFSVKGDKSDPAVALISVPQHVNECALGGRARSGGVYVEAEALEMLLKSVVLQVLPTATDTTMLPTQVDTPTQLSTERRQQLDTLRPSYGAPSSNRTVSPLAGQGGSTPVPSVGRQDMEPPLPFLPGVGGSGQPPLEPFQPGGMGGGSYVGKR